MVNVCMWDVLAICITPANPTTSNLQLLYKAGVNCREKRMEHITTDSGKSEGQSKVGNMAVNDVLEAHGCSLKWQ